jgi:hypothetical protein
MRREDRRKVCFHATGGQLSNIDGIKLTCGVNPEIIIAKLMTTKSPYFYFFALKKYPLLRHMPVFLKKLLSLTGGSFVTVYTPSGPKCVS